MDFSLNDDQKQLRDSVAKFVKGSYDFEKRRHIVKNDAGLNAEVWGQFAELGWLMLPFSEEDGGIGGSVVDTMVLLEELGRGLVVEPYIPTVVLAGGLIKRGSAEQKAKYLESLVSGGLQGAFAVSEYEQAFDLANTAFKAEAKDGGYVLNGTKSVVLNGDRADVIGVVARTSGKPGDKDGLSVFLVNGDAAGLSRKVHRVVDGSNAAELRFDSVKVGADALVGEAGKGAELAQAIINEGILALGAEATGALSVLVYTTVEYTKTRKQFGVAIGNFQALQHRMADMFMAYEQVRSLLMCATLKVNEGHDDAQQAVHALKSLIGRAGRHIAQEAVQLHGGMGMTDELHIGHYFKRITAIDALFGNADQHTRAFGQVYAA